MAPSSRRSELSSDQSETAHATPPIDGAEDPRPWLTAGDSTGWRARPRSQRQTTEGAKRPTLKQSVLVHLDSAQVAWLERRAAEAGTTLATALEELVEQARVASEQHAPT